MRQLTYRVLSNREPEGGYTATALPGCITYGETVDEATMMAKEAIELYVESLVAHNEPVPDESNMLEYALTIPLLYEQYSFNVTKRCCEVTSAKKFNIKSKSWKPLEMAASCFPQACCYSNAQQIFTNRNPFRINATGWY